VGRQRGQPGNGVRGQRGVFLIDWERAGEDGKLVEICASRFQQDLNER